MVGEYRWEEIECACEFAMRRLIRSAKGAYIIIAPKRLAKVADLSTKPVVLTLVRHYLDRLVDEGKAILWKRTSHGRYYMVFIRPEAKALFMNGNGFKEG